jgi:hypothetical protein
MTTPAFLRELAQELRLSTPELVAVDMLKKAGFDDTEAHAMVAQETMEKTACFALTEKGFDPEEAVKLVKAANINVRDLANVCVESKEEILADVLVKAAETIESLQTGMSKQASVATDLEHQLEIAKTPEPEVPEAILKMAQAGGFSYEELEAMSTLPEALLEKVAAASEQPWSMGKAAGVNANSMDPIAAFCMND